MADVQVREIMTTGVVTLGPEDLIHEAARRLAQAHITGAPVVEAGRIVGIVTESDILRADLLGSLDVLGEEVFSGLDVTIEDGVATIYGTADRRSTHDIALRMASRTPGIVQVRDHLDFIFDDSHMAVPSYAPVELDPRRNWTQDAR